MVTKFATIAQADFISDGQPHIAHLQLWKEEPSGMFLIQSKIPSNYNPILGLCFFQLPVIVCFGMNQGSKDILIYVGIRVLKLNGLKFVIDRQIWIR